MIATDNIEVLPAKELLEYIDSFYGYGSWEINNFWFIGIEEGGGKLIENVKNRLDSWQKLGKTALIDCR